MEQEAGYLEQFGNQGLEQFTADTMSTSYLSMIQPNSEFETPETPSGTWRNSTTGENYGSTVNVIVLGFKTIWVERDKEPPFNTVGRYEPHTIPVETKPVPTGKRGYPKMYNPKTGNEVKELYVYAVMLPEHLEAGVLFFNPTVSSMRVCKNWNKQISSQLFSNGKRMPIFACVWALDVGLIPNPTNPKTQISVLKGAKRVGIVGKETFETAVQPQLQIVPNMLLLSGSSDTDEKEPTEASLENEFLEN